MSEGWLIAPESAVRIGRAVKRVESMPLTPEGAGGYGPSPLVWGMVRVVEEVTGAVFDACSPAINNGPHKIYRGVLYQWDSSKPCFDPGDWSVSESQAASVWVIDPHNRDLYPPDRHIGVMIESDRTIGSETKPVVYVSNIVTNKVKTVTYIPTGYSFHRVTSCKYRVQYGIALMGVYENGTVSFDNFDDTFRSYDLDICGCNCGSVVTDPVCGGCCDLEPLGYLVGGSAPSLCGLRFTWSGRTFEYPTNYCGGVTGSWVDNLCPPKFHLAGCICDAAGGTRCSGATEIDRRGLGGCGNANLSETFATCCCDSYGHGVGFNLSFQCIPEIGGPFNGSLWQVVLTIFDNGREYRYVTNTTALGCDPLSVIVGTVSAGVTMTSVESGSPAVSDFFVHVSSACP